MNTSNANSKAENTTPPIRKQPLVSIVVTTYNSSKYIKQCIESIAAQTYTNYEVIFVDNASQDSTIEIVQKLAKILLKDKRVVIIQSKRNRGYCGGNNIGIKHSKGDYIAIVNPDIILDKNWLETLVQALEKNPNIAACQGKILYNKKIINSTGNLTDKYGATLCRGEFELDRNQYITGSEGFFYISGAAFLARRDPLQQAGFFDVLLFLYHDDLDLCWRLRLMGYRLLYVGEAICYHIKNITNTSILTKINATKLYFYYRNRLIILLKNYSINYVVKYLSLALILNTLNSLLLSMLHRKCYILIMAKAIIDVIKKARIIIIKRREVQTKRKVADSIIIKYMNKRPLEILAFKLILN